MYLRLSVTDRCGFRCPYCQPDAPDSVTPGASMLSPAEIRRIVSVLADLGTSHVRLTGGEPLARRDALQIVESVSTVRGIRDVAITTNGQGLAARAQALKDAGLTRVNIHIDTLREDRYRSLTRSGSLSAALRGLEAALAADLRPVKINTVLMKGVNDDELDAFGRMAAEWGVTVRFIELMNTGPASAFVHRHFLSAFDARAQLARAHTLTPRFADRGGSPAREFDLDRGAATIGFIASETEAFCASCNRIRLTCDGQLKTCLYESGGHDLRALVRDSSITDDTLRDRAALALGAKRSHHPAFGQTGAAPFAMAHIGG
jgi:cyclic pyranopterin phosphate synthase